MASVHHHEWRLRASADKLWPYVADTQRLNAALGLPQWEFQDERTPIGKKRTGRMTYMGMEISWDERPYEWTEGKELSVERAFHNGPVLSYRSHVRLEPLEGGGTLLRHSLEFEPRVRALALVGHFEFGVRVKRSLDRVYNEIDAFLAGEAPSPYPPKIRALPPRNRERLVETARRLVIADGFDRPLVERFVSYLHEVDEETLVRLRPLAIADRWLQDRSRVLALFVRAAARGVLVLGWDIICPSCRGPKLRVEELKRLETEAHCETCDVKIDTRAARALELVFSLSPAIATVEAKMHCKGSPRNTPHVVLQRRVRAGHTLREALVLTPGTYRLRGSGIEKPGFLTVRGDLPAGGVSLLVQQDAVFPWEVASGPAIELAVTNEAELERVITLERAAWHDDAVTTARAFACEEFLAAFPRQLPPPSLQLSAGRLAIVAVWTDHERATASFEKDEKALIGGVLDGIIAEEARRHAGALVRTEGGRLLAFTTPEAALAAAASLGTSIARFGIERRLGLEPRLALAASPCAVVASSSERPLVEGEAVSDARALLGIAGGGEVLLDAALAVEARVEDGETFEHGGRALVRKRFPPPSIEALPGAVLFEDLALGDRLGEGATAAVFVARHKRDGRRLALKVLKAADGRSRARFVRELEAFYRLHGVPGLVRCHGYGDRGGDLWIALDLVEGIPLDRQLRELGRFQVARAAAVLAPVAHALHAVHARGVLHRDVKPANIIIDAASKPWLVDFGIARLGHEPQAPWAATGTLGYMPPEALDPQIGVDARADVYSLGATFYELVAGRPLFQSSSSPELVVKIMSESPVDLVEAAPGSTSAAARIARHALRKRPEDRYDTAEELALDLELLARGEFPVFAPDDAEDQKTTKKFKTTLLRRAIDVLKLQKEGE
jgi:hypothetical protein